MKEMRNASNATKGEEGVMLGKQGKPNHKWYSDKSRNSEQKGYDNTGRAWAQLRCGKTCGVEGEAAMSGVKTARRGVTFQNHVGDYYITPIRAGFRGRPRR